MEDIEYSPEHIPTLDHLDSKVPDATGWTIVRTDVRFTDADEWYRFFDRHELLITNFMRSWEEFAKYFDPILERAAKQ